MPMGIIIAIAVVLVIAAAVLSHFLTVSSLKKNAESKIGNAETRARQIIDGSDPQIGGFGNEDKPLSIAIAELHDSKIKILSEEDSEIKPI